MPELAYSPELDALRLLAVIEDSLPYRQKVALIVAYLKAAQAKGKMDGILAARDVVRDCINKGRNRQQRAEHRKKHE